MRWSAQERPPGRRGGQPVIRRRALARCALALALASGGGLHGCDRGPDGPAAPEKGPAPPAHPFETRYRSPECAADPSCRQLKRIWEEGGASEEAVAANLDAADSALTFDEVEEDAGRYEGTAWSFKGTIADVIAHETRGRGDYIVADLHVDGDPGQLVAVRGDLLTEVGENDRVVVVGYLNGTSRARPGSPPLEYRGRRVVDMSARAILTPGEARELGAATGTK